MIQWTWAVALVCATVFCNSTTGAEPVQQTRFGFAEVAPFSGLGSGPVRLSFRGSNDVTVSIISGSPSPSTFTDRYGGADGPEFIREIFPVMNFFPGPPGPVTFRWDFGLGLGTNDFIVFSDLDGGPDFTPEAESVRIEAFDLQGNPLVSLAGWSFQEFVTGYSIPGYAGFSTRWDPATGELASDAVDKTGAVILLRPDRPVGSLVYTYRPDSFEFSAANFQFYSPAIPRLAATRAGSDLRLEISGGLAPFQLQRRDSLLEGWQDFGGPFWHSVTNVPLAGQQSFLRVLGR